MARINIREFFTSSSLVFFAAVILAFVLVWQASNAALENFALQKEVDELKSEVELLELENQQITYNIEYFKTDSYLALAARENFNLKSPGERVIYVPKYEKVDSDENAGSDGSSEDVVEKSNFELWVDFLFGRSAS